MNANTKFEIFVVDHKGQSASLPVPHDDYLETLREFIDFLNHQVGLYTDALASFAGNKARIEFQVARSCEERRSGRTAMAYGVRATGWIRLTACHPNRVQAIAGAAGEFMYAAEIVKRDVQDDAGEMTFKVSLKSFIRAFRRDGDPRWAGPSLS